MFAQTKHKKEFDMFNLIAILIVIAGAVNWLIIGIFQFDVIAGLFGSQSVFLSRFFYTLIGLAGLWLLLLLGITKGQINLKQKKNKKDKNQK